MLEVEEPSASHPGRQHLLESTRGTPRTPPPVDHVPRDLQHLRPGPGFRPRHRSLGLRHLNSTAILIVAAVLGLAAAHGWLPWADEMRDLHLGSVLAVRLWTSQSTLGALNLYACSP